MRGLNDIHVLSGSEVLSKIQILESHRRSSEKGDDRHIPVPRDPKCSRRQERIERYTIASLVKGEQFRFEGVYE